MVSKQKDTTPKKGFTDEEKEAMKERIKELKGEQIGERVVLEKIKEMPENDRKLAEVIHQIVKENAPNLLPRLWYGMPAYSNGNNVVIYFQGAYKFKARYAVLGFSDKANLDEGSIWPVAYAIKEISENEEKFIAELVRKAIGRYS